ncbi:hypothetical protein RGQ01_13810 [Akkermansia sp. EB-AMDK43]|jgi:hypothetical protein|nr:MULTISPECIES: hypothetical protein [unclassified Akkermansia]WMX38069.1 hypothetical protein RGQ01_13810 [Akkermansia sp. EB-AMDK43]
MHQNDPISGNGHIQAGYGFPCLERGGEVGGGQVQGNACCVLDKEGDVIGSPPGKGQIGNGGNHGGN